MIKKQERKEMNSYILVLLVHVIKIHAEKRKTRSWQNSIRNAVKKINELKDKKADLSIDLEEHYETALAMASTEIMYGIEISKLESILDQELIILHCLSLIDL